MRLFAEVAEAGSLSGAARALGITKQTVSRRLSELEQSLGVELARRTTRRLTLTDVGRAYAARCAEVVRLAEEANAALASHVDRVAGTVRVTADVTFGEAFLPDVLSAFLAAHPEVEIDLMLTARKVDLVEEGFDIAFRVGPPPEVTHLAARRLGPARLWSVAAPSYLRRRAAPLVPSDLAEHECVALVPSLAQTGWPFQIEGQLRLLPIRARARVNGLTMARHAALAGAGIAHLPEFAARADVQAGRLVRLLEAFTPEVGGVHVVYPHSKLLAPRVTELVALAIERYAAFG